MRFRHRAVSALIGAALPLCLATGVLAHDIHHYPKVTLALGWLHEPAYTGFDNAVQVIVKDAAGNAITAITERDLTVDVSLGTAQLNGLQLLPTADPDTGLGTPGEYQVHFIPTAPGNYTFHLKGTVTGQVVDETVTAGDTTFAPVTSATDVEFPNKVPANADLNTKLDQVGQRVTDAASSAQSAAQSAQNTATPALVVGLVGLVIALLAIGGVVVVRRRPAG